MSTAIDWGGTPAERSASYPGEAKGSRGTRRSPSTSSIDRGQARASVLEPGQQATNRYRSHVVLAERRGAFWTVRTSPGPSGEFDHLEVSVR